MVPPWTDDWMGAYRWLIIATGIEFARRRQVLDPVEDLCASALAEAEAIDREMGDADKSRADLLRELVICLRAQRAAAKGHWEDAKDTYTKDINLAHPLVTKNWGIYQTAMAMISNRHGKYELIDLVNWLLYRIEKLTLIVRTSARVRAQGRPTDKMELDNLLGEWEQGG